MQVRERVERRKLDDGLDLALEQHRQHDDVARQRLEQRRADRHGVVAAIGDEHAALRPRAHWPIRPSPELQIAGGWPFDAVVGIGRQQRRAPAPSLVRPDR